MRSIRLPLNNSKLIDNGARPEDNSSHGGRRCTKLRASLRLAQTQATTKTWEKDIELARSQVETARAGLISAEVLETAKSWEAEITSAKTARTQAAVGLKLAQKRLKDATIFCPDFRCRFQTLFRFRWHGSAYGTAF